MELSGSNIKKFIIFSYISGNENPPRVNFLSFKKWEPQKNFLYFVKRKKGNGNPEKKSLHFRKRKP